MLTSKRDPKTNLLKSSLLKSAAIGGLLILVLAACDLATLSGGGSGDSPISGGRNISLAIETKELCLKGTERDCEIYSYQGGVQSVTGEFKDSGTNPAWPYGVSMKFEGAYTSTEKRNIGVLLLAGDVCNELLGVPEDAPEGDPVGAQVNGSKDSKNANCWLGGVGYRSADPRHYPNSTPCFGDSAVVSDALRSGFGRALGSPVVSETIKRLERDINSDRDRGPKENRITGQALVLIVDANLNGRIDEDAESSKSADAFIIISVCGPYSGIGRTRSLGSGYNYSTCPGGTLSSDSFIGSAISRRCLVPLRGGDLKIKIIPTTSTSTTSTTMPPTPI